MLPAHLVLWTAGSSLSLVLVSAPPTPPPGPRLPSECRVLGARALQDEVGRARQRHSWDWTSEERVLGVFFIQMLIKRQLYAGTHPRHWGFGVRKTDGITPVRLRLWRGRQMLEGRQPDCICDSQGGGQGRTLGAK